jgi:hypothetical protein
MQTKHSIIRTGGIGAVILAVVIEMAVFVQWILQLPVLCRYPVNLY